tara:strand:- start:752 stop:1120 length:369 start_codon:yes stop_codon:yes gene_type:complete
MNKPNAADRETIKALEVELTNLVHFGSNNENAVSGIVNDIERIKLKYCPYTQALRAFGLEYLRQQPYCPPSKPRHCLQAGSPFYKVVKKLKASPENHTEEEVHKILVEKWNEGILILEKAWS